MKKRIWLPLSAAVFFASVASAENLHQEYGSAWQCSFLSDSAPYKALCLACEQDGKEFDKQGNGGACVAKSSSASSLQSGKRVVTKMDPLDERDLKDAHVPRPPAQEIWIAVAGGFDGNGGRVSVGFSGHRYSRAEAESAALSACNRSGGVHCRNPHAVSYGCLYIVPGNRRGGVTWGRGNTRDLALSECRRGGYSCSTQKVAGGCVPGYTN